jgi:acyl-CoA synthetase (AMP-forming)/AMP-acid ligase II
MHANTPITASDIVRKALLTTADRIAVSLGDTEWTGRHLAACGQAQIGTAVKILAEDGHEVPVGKEGEICARRPLVMQRYWKNLETTGEVFKHAGCIPASGAAR